MFKAPVVLRFLFSVTLSVALLSTAHCASVDIIPGPDSGSPSTEDADAGDTPVVRQDGGRVVPNEDADVVETDSGNRDAATDSSDADSGEPDAEPDAAPNLPVTVSKQAIEFGSVACGATGTAVTFDIDNPGTVPATWTATLETTGDDSRFDLSARTGTIQPGQKTTVTVTPKAIGAEVQPTPQGFSDNVHLLVSRSDGDDNFDVSLHESVQGIVVNYTGQNVDFGTTRTGATQPLEFRNTGNVAAHLNLSVTAPYSITPAGPLNIAPGATASVTLTFDGATMEIGTIARTVTVQSTDARCAALPTVAATVNHLDSPLQIAAGDSATCMVGTSGRVFCWGLNDLGQLGSDVMGQSDTPTLVQNLTDAVAVAVGGAHACAIRQNGHVVCWGSNGQVPPAGSTDVLGPGQLGNGTNLDSVTPVEVTGLTDVTQIVAGVGHTCALRKVGGAATGSVLCWGGNFYGVLGNGTTTDSNVPVSVGVVGSDVVAIDSQRAHTCALRSNGQVFCWGGNIDYELGDSATGGEVVPTPAPVQGISDALEVVTSGFHTCVRRATGAVVCFGINTYGRLGLNDITDPNPPYALAHAVIESPLDPESVPVNTLTDVVRLDAGLQHTCALRTNHTLACWGRNAEGGLGNGLIGNGTVDPTTMSGDRGPTASPTTVLTLTDVASVAVGFQHTCALTSDRVPYCWGANEAGELGLGDTNRRLVPTRVIGY